MGIRDRHPDRRCRTAVLILALLAIASITLLDAAAQSTSQAVNGIVALSDWPEQRGDETRPVDFSRFRLLPFIDTLTVGYRFDRSRGRPAMEFALEWTLAEAGVVRGRRVNADELPETVVIESIELSADVVVDGEPAATFYLPLDTIRLRPAPSVALIEIRDVDWDNVFVDMDSARTRQIFSAGFTLADLRILRVVFNTEAPDTAERLEAPPEEEWTTVIVPDVDVWVALGGRRRWRPPVTVLAPTDRERRGETGRGDLVDKDRRDRGYDRGDEQDTDEEADADDREPERSERTSRRKKGSGDRGGVSLPGKKKSNDDNDDDEDRLLPGALAGVAAIGALAAFGGTLGYTGNIDKAPIGLMAGRVEPRGGVLFHVAVNRQVFGKARGPENLLIGVTGFMNVFRSPVQPLIGIGLRITEEGTATTRTLPTVSVGVAANLGQVLMFTAYDIEARNARVGFGVNFRAILADD